MAHGHYTETALESWTALNNDLRSIDEQGAKKLLEAERKGKRRIAFLLRIYGKYNTLRSVRERRELIQTTGKVV